MDNADEAVMYYLNKIKRFAKSKLDEGFSKEEIRPLIILKIIEASPVTGMSGHSPEEMADHILKYIDPE